VSDPTGEAADGFHAMGMMQLLFQLSLASDVPDVRLNVLVPVLNIGTEISGDGDTENAAVFFEKAGLEAAHMPGGL
jgi:hypothetical protein